MWWFLKRDDKVVIFQNGQAARSKGGRIFGDVHAVRATDADKLMMTFNGGVHATLALKKFDAGKSDLLSEWTESDDLSSQDFSRLVAQEISQTPSTGSQTPMPTASTPMSGHRKKRQRPPVSETPAKRQVVEYEDEYTKELKRKCLGEHEVQLKSLQHPPSTLLLRPINSKHTDNIKEGLKETSSCSTVLPVLLIGEDFNLGTSQYYTLGGNHLTAAMRDLTGDEAFAELHVVKVRVYKGLTRTEALRVASLHNVSTHLVEERSLQDNVEVCRSLLYDVNHVDTCLEPPPSNKIWREQCSLALGKKTPIASKDMKSLEPTFQLAQYSTRCYEKLKKVFALYKEKKGSSLKQTVFLKLQGLSETTRYGLLSEVVSERLTLAEMTKEADKAKKLVMVQNEMVKQLPNVTTWEEAERLYPQHTTERAMQPFTGCNFKQGIPRPFLKFIKDAIVWKERQKQEWHEDQDDSLQLLKNDRSTVAFQCTFCAETVKGARGFTSAKLVFCNMEENTTQFETMMKIIGSVCQVETVICITVSSATVSPAIQLLQDNDFQGLVTYYHFLPVHKGAVTGEMTIYLKAVYRADDADSRREGFQSLLMENPIRHVVFKDTQEGDWVIDLTKNATAAQVCSQHARNAVVIAASGDALRMLQRDVATNMQDGRSITEEDSMDEYSSMSLDSDDD